MNYQLTAVYTILDSMPVSNTSCMLFVNGKMVISVSSYHNNWASTAFILRCWQLHQPRLWFITGGYLVKRWFLPTAARARGQSNDLNREILASNLFNCRKEVINAPPVPSISRCIHIVYRHKNVWEYQWSNFIYNCMSTFLHYDRCKDALLDCSAPGGERCESLTWVDVHIVGRERSEASELMRPQRVQGKTQWKRNYCFFLLFFHFASMICLARMCLYWYQLAEMLINCVSIITVLLFSLQQ